MNPQQIKRLVATGLLFAVSACSSANTTTATPTTAPPAAATTVAATKVPTTAATTTIAATTTVATTTGKAAAPVAASCPEGAPTSLACKTVAVALDPAKPDGAKIDLAVTVRQADASKWTSPIVVAGPVSWAALAYLDPATPSFVGHDLIEIDWRGEGRSDGGSAKCPALKDYTGEFNTWRLSSSAATAAKACLAKGDPAILALQLDHSVSAADVVAVRRALGIDKWMMWAGTGNVDHAMHILKLDGAAVTAFMARDPYVIGTPTTATASAEAFDRFAADCAKSPKCAANGDMKALLAKALDRLKIPVTTKTLDKATPRRLLISARSTSSRKKQRSSSVSGTEPTYTP